MTTDTQAAMTATQHPTSDGDLVRRYVASTDRPAREAAFAALVERHASMVLGTCRRIVGAGVEAEDAAQAVFVTLAAKAGELTSHPSLGGWLHRVSWHVALRHRAAAQARTRHEQEAGSMPTPPPPADVAQLAELREELDGALDRLGERYRLPLILHYLEGRSQEEVARLLALNPGTLASLLSRGREQLRSVLARRGLSVSALALTTLLVGEATAASVPSGFVAGATASATGGIAALTTASPQIAALSHGAMHTMNVASLIAKLKLAAVLAGSLAAGGVALAAGSSVSTGNAAEVPTALAAVAVAEPPPAPVPAEGPESAVTNWVRALRSSDFRALASRATPEAREAAARGVAGLGGRPPAGGGGAGNFQDRANEWLQRLPPERRAEMERVMQGLRGGGGLDRIAGLLGSPDAGRLLQTALEPLVRQLKPARLAELLKTESASDAQQVVIDGAGVSVNTTNRGNSDPAAAAAAALNAQIGALIASCLADGLESEQTKAVQGVVDALAAWLPQSGIDDPAKGGPAIEKWLDAARALGRPDAAAGDQPPLSLDELVSRFGASFTELKKLLLVYGIDADRVLDSVQVVAAPGAGDTRQLTLTFTAFDKAHRIPLKAHRVQERWELAADSPLARWLRPRSAGNQPRGNTPGNNPRGQGGRPGGGRPDRPPGGAPAPGGQPAKPDEGAQAF